ncbi:hypothetical protein BN1708_005713 [Verticillium longisporum]|uniref:Uncharacterized protein n=1 Tax=Verticillium longisporum TaxID=100787 RepID=A0A0G4MDL5_VERLO|nr:hypothetical protein BN1708_005713 [Verticillium longisporum]
MTLAAGLAPPISGALSRSEWGGRGAVAATPSRNCSSSSSTTTSNLIVLAETLVLWLLLLLASTGQADENSLHQWTLSLSSY